MRAVYRKGADLRVSLSGAHQGLLNCRIRLVALQERCEKPPYVWLINIGGENVCVAIAARTLRHMKLQPRHKLSADPVVRNKVAEQWEIAITQLRGMVRFDQRDEAFAHRRIPTALSQSKKRTLVKIDAEGFDSEGIDPWLAGIGLQGRPEGSDQTDGAEAKLCART